MYKCTDCGRLLDKEFLTCHHDHSGSCGEPLEPDEYESCGCGGEWEEPYRCLECADWFLEDEMIEGICEECQESLFTFELMKEYINSEKEREVEFYVNYMTNSDVDEVDVDYELIHLCIAAFEKGLTYRKNDAIQDMLDYCREDMSEYIYWAINR